MSETASKPRSLRTASIAEPGANLSTLAVAIGMAVSGAAWAQDEPATETEDKAKDKSIEIVEVYGQQNAPYKALRSGDVRRPVDLADTPQTISVLTQTQVRDSGKTDLKEILEAQPGITIGTGENGNAFGDRYIIRGHEARSDVFVDGVRDPGMTIRESFAAEQIEITKGPSSTFAGRGSSGGAINSITKRANPDEDFMVLDGGIGTDAYHRLVFDVNQSLPGTAAVRVNLLEAAEEVPDRDPADRQRQGGLLSGFYQLTDRLSLVADYYSLKGKDDPDLGSYFDQAARAPVEDMPVYLQNPDFLDTKVDSFTVRLEYDWTASLALHNATRYGTTDNGYVTTGARGATRDAADPFAPGAATISLSTHQGWQEVEYLVNQTNLLWDRELGGMENRFVFGAEFSSEEVANGLYAVTNTGASNCLLAGRPGGTPGYCILDGAGQVVPDVHNLMGRQIQRSNEDSHFEVDTISLYLMDTITFSQNWEGFFGLRHDSFDYSNRLTAQGVQLDFEYDDSFWNGHVGIVRKLGESGNVYLSWSTATNINGGESDVGGSCGYGGLCGTPEQVSLSDPEQVDSLELGSKWQLFDDRLLATAAVFLMEKSDVMESVGNDYTQLGTLNTGENEVKGVEFSLTGAITDSLSTQFGATFMDSEVTASYIPSNVGLALSNFADESAYFQLRYEPFSDFALGGAWTYTSEMYAGQPDSAAGYNPVLGDYSVIVPDYNVFDLFLEYYPRDNLSLRLNMLNATDKTYWVAAYRSGAFMYFGDARATRLTLTWSP